MFRKYEDYSCKKFDLLIVPQEAMYLKYKKLAKTIVIGQNDNKPLLTSSAISRIESGCKDKPESYPNLKSLEILANALNIHITELFPPKQTLENEKTSLSEM